MRELAAAIFNRVFPADKSPNAIALRELRRKLRDVPRRTPGRVSIAGWDLRYVDAPALISSFEILVVKGWNDFITGRENPVILDCGANIGLSVLNYKRRYPMSVITAFEPDISICEVLRENLNNNNAKDVKVVQAAVWTKAGEHAFFSEGADGSRLVDPVPAGDTSSDKYLVQTVRLADYLAGPEITDFVKLDIEGAEVEVLTDCAARLRNVRKMIVEVHFSHGRPRDLAVVVSALADAGFRVSLNSYGKWVDLSHQPKADRKRDLGDFDQYFIMAAWRD